MQLPVPRGAGQRLTASRLGGAAALELLRDGERYAYDLVHALAEVDGLVTSEGTMYPLLSRLRREDLVTTTWVESESGPPRRYYALTDQGRSALDRFLGEWATFRNAVDDLMTTGDR